MILSDWFKDLAIATTLSISLIGGFIVWQDTRVDV